MDTQTNKVTDMTSMMSTSTDPEIQGKAQNTVNKSHASQSAGIINQQLEQTLSVQQQAADIALQSAQLGVQVVQHGNEVTAKLNQDVKGTTDMINMLEQQQMDATVKETALHEAGKDISFLSSPIDFIRNRTAQREQRRIVQGNERNIQFGKSQIDREYGEAAQDMEQWKSANINTKAAQLQVDAITVRQAQMSADTIAKAKQKIVDVQQADSQKNHIVDDSVARALKMQTIVRDLDVVGKAWSAMAGHDPQDYTPQDAHTANTYITALPAQETAAFQQAATRFSYNPESARKPGEALPAYKVRFTQGIIASADKNEAANVAMTAARVGGDSPIRDLMVMGEESQFQGIPAEAQRQIYEENGIDPNNGAKIPDEIKKAIHVRAQNIAATVSSQDKLKAAGSALGARMQDMYNHTYEIPSKFAGAAALMNTKPLPVEIRDWFSSDDARLAIDHAPIISLDRRLDTAYDMLGRLSKVEVNGKPIGDAQAAAVVSDFVNSSFAGYHQVHGGKDAELVATLNGITAGTGMPKPGIVVTHVNGYGNAKPFNIGNPDELLNLSVRQGGKAAEINSGFTRAKVTGNMLLQDLPVVMVPTELGKAAKSIGSSLSDALSTKSASDKK